MKLNDIAQNLVTWVTITQWVTPWLVGLALGQPPAPANPPMPVAMQQAQTKT